MSCCKATSRRKNYDAQLLKAIHPLPRILAARNAQIALATASQPCANVETEGAMYADVDVKHAINNGEVPARTWRSPRAP